VSEVSFPRIIFVRSFQHGASLGVSNAAYIPQLSNVSTLQQLQPSNATPPTLHDVPEQQPVPFDNQPTTWQPNSSMDMATPL
jgi:hypothetical protein